MDDVVRDIQRRLRALERSAVRLRRGEITALSPNQVKLGGAPSAVRMPTLGSHGVGSIVEALTAGSTGLILAGLKLHTTTATTSGPTTTSTADPPTTVLSEMSITADFGGNPVVVLFTGTFSQDTTGARARVGLRDTTAGTNLARREHRFFLNGAPSPIPLIHAYTPASGSRTLAATWGVNAGIGTAQGTERQLVILELRSAG